MVASRVPCESEIPARLWPVMQDVRPNQPDDVKTGSNVHNPPDTERPGVQTRQQSAAEAMANESAIAAAAQAAAKPAPAASRGVQSVTATIDYHSLATAQQCCRVCRNLGFTAQGDDP